MALDISYNPGTVDRVRDFGLHYTEAQMRSNRTKLLEDIWQNRDTSSSTANLMISGCPVDQRYDLLKFVQLLQENSQSLIQLQRLPVAFTILEKYARHLLRPPRDRSAQWKLIKYQNPIFASKVDVIKGGRYIMYQMGYIVDIGDGLSFPDGVEPNPNQLVSLVADIVLARHELEAFSRGDHPNAAQLEPFISPSVRSELNGVYLTNNLPGGLHVPTPLPNQENGLLANAAPPIPSRDLKPVYSPAEEASAHPVVSSCDICGVKSPEMICTECDSKQLCVSCNEKWHRHPKRQGHKRTYIAFSKPVPQPRNSLSPKTDKQAVKNFTFVTRPAWELQNQISPVAVPSYPARADAPLPEPPRQTSPTNSDETFYSMEETSPTPKGDSKEAQSVLPNLSIFKSDYQSAQSTEAQNNSNSGSKRHIRGGHSTPAGDMPPPLPSVFFTENYDTPKAQARRDLACLEGEVADLEKSLESLIVSSPDFYENPKYIQLTRLKDIKLRKKIELLRKIQSFSGVPGQETIPASGRFPIKALIDQPVFYPPAVSRQTGPGGPPDTPVQTFDQYQSSQLTRSPSVQLPRPSKSALRPTVSQPVLYPGRPGEAYSSNTLPARTGYSTLPYSASSRSAQPGPVTNIPSSDIVSPMQVSSGGPRGGRKQFSSRWECSHCTYMNDPGDNICRVCDRTSDNPHQVPHTTGSQPSVENPVSAVPGYRTRTVHEEAEQVMMEKKEAQKRYSMMQEQPGQSLEQQQNVSNSKVETVSELREGQKTVEPESGEMAASGPSPLRFSNSDSGESDQSSLGERSQGGTGTWEEGSTNVAEALEAVQQRKAMVQQLTDGRNVISLLKKADELGFVPEELQIAIEMCSDKNPIDWLKEDWRMKVDAVIASATHEGKVATHNAVGQISEVEAKESLKRSWGNLEEAVKECANERKKKFQQLVVEGPFPRDAILNALNKHDGDVDKALTELQSAQLQPYLNRIWDNPNESQEAMLMAAANHEQDLVANSVIYHEDFQEKVRDTTIDYERRVRMVLVEGRLQGWIRSKAVIHIFTQTNMNFALQDVIEAVRNCGDVNSSLVYLQQECEICFSTYPMSQIRNFTHCPCKICTECLTQHLELVIKEQFIRNWACPVCQRPDIQQDDQAASEHFTFLDMLLPMLVSKEVRDIFQTKLRDWRLMQDPNFRWCAHCGNGFIFNNANQLKMECTYCEQLTCFKCKKPWEPQHEGLSCEQFAQWKFDNNPENQATGLARHLNQNGIVCPSCKMRYALAKGGCMHFKCPQCGHEFCSGCMLPFRRAENCKQYRWCQGQGLHCHHPRNCFFYLRDNDVEELQRLLERKSVAFNTELPADQEDTTACPVMEQKELQSRFQDEPCGREVQQGHAGLCQNHYKEYLVGLVNKHNIDPVHIMDTEKIQNLLKKMEKDVPAMGRNEAPQQYHKRLTQFLKERVPIPRVDSSGHLHST